MDTVKQVIVMRKDLKIRRGKECVQAAHASMKWLIDRLEYKEQISNAHIYYEPSFSNVEHAWLQGLFTKVCVTVGSEQELMEIYNKAFGAGLMVKLITDSGLTEFNGVPTKTCLAIGPDIAERIDPITSHLKLY